MKTIGILLPCYNEENNVVPIAESIIELFRETLSNYNFNIVFIDNNSNDGTIKNLRKLCSKNPNVKVIINARNFRWSSSWHGIINTPGDCVICIPSDFQVPINVIPQLVEKWENGAKVVCLIKESSEERKTMWLTRQMFYKFAQHFSDDETLPNFTGALYDQSFLNICKQIGDPMMYLSLRSFICSHGYDIEKVIYKQAKRKSGKSSNTFSDLCYIALLRFTESSSKVPFLTVISGVYMGILSALLLSVLIIRGIFLCVPIINSFFIICCIFMACSIQLIYMGVIGEYLMKINVRLQKRPVVIERERINF